MDKEETGEAKRLQWTETLRDLVELRNTTLVNIKASFRICGLWIGVVMVLGICYRMVRDNIVGGKSI